MSMYSAGRCVLLASAITVCMSACALAPVAEPQGSSNASKAAQIGRTMGRFTYTDTPVDVKLGPSIFRIPANYLDSQIAPWPGEGVSLVIEWPDMVATAPGARAHPRTNDFRREIRISVDYIDRVPIEKLLERRASNESITEPGSLERNDPRDRLDLRLAQPEVMGLTPYAVDEGKMPQFVDLYTAKFGRPPPRSRLSENDWYVARSPDGRIATFIKCDSVAYVKDGVRLEGRDIVNVPDEIPIAGCNHYIVDIENSLAITLSYYRVFLKDWKRMEVATRELLERSKAG
ncbi:hypothetical protein [Stenotrophomonas sp. PS02289]|uniref:hypothetical protein n=1 Tax=Stenotrophomonas sp. PS02289 TaxID=2991422 RepID=UPI00249A7179|nr:hypothetical protein [Stenotrophomonas sp. PS02289]